MTLPPCFAQSPSRHPKNSSTVSPERNSFHRVGDTRTHVSKQYVQNLPPFMLRTSEPNTKAPEDFNRRGSVSKIGDSSTMKIQETNEDNAALMLLELSKIATKEITIKQATVSAHDDAATQSCTRSGTFSDVPKSIEVEESSSAGLQAHGSSSSLSSNDSLENSDTGASLVTKESSSGMFSTPSRSQDMTSSASAESIAGNAPLKRVQRFRTVSLAGDDMNASGGHRNLANERDLSPLLMPLSSPSRSIREQLSSLGIHISAPTARHPPRPRFRNVLLQHELERLEQQQQQLLQQEHEQREAIRMALQGALGSSAAAAIITPIPQEPRRMMSFPATVPPVTSVQNKEEPKVRAAPLELPPLLLTMNREAKTQPAVPASSNLSIDKPTKLIPSTHRKNADIAPKKKAAVRKYTKTQRKGGKKFSWKNYPELEEFLIENREEYLSFSARNYTIEQRDYNNRLTARLLDHANAHGYSSLFETSAFSVVRDRIRSYYKSYVQSFKRRRERQLQQQRRQNAAR